MKSLKAALLVLFIALIASCTGQPSNPADYLSFPDDNGGITLPDGFKAVKVADSLGNARHITVADNGDIYVVLRRQKDGNGIVALRDSDNDGQADQIEYFGNIAGTGIQLHQGYLYVSSDTSVHRYEMTEGQLVPDSEPQTIVSGFPNQNSHAAKSFTFDGAGNIYVNVGAPSNACQEEGRTPGSPGQDPCPQLEWQAGIWQFSATTTGQSQQEDGHRYATGIRNAVALDWNNTANSLYLVQHGRDQLNTLWPDHYTDEENAALPAEEFFKVDDGDNFGWPYAYYDWQKEQKMVMPEYGGDGETPVEEGQYENPIMAFPGHWAPNDLLFYNGTQFPQEFRNGAFIAFHGSWNRAPEPQQGYKVVFVPFSGENPSGEYSDFATGFPGTQEPQPGTADHRPMGLAQGPQGSLYITDSVEGTIWRVVYTGM